MPSTVDAYLDAQPPGARRILTRVRTVIRRALPKAEEVISYGIPAYRLNGRIALYFAGWKSHFSLYPISKRLAKELAGELAPYEQSHKGTIRFALDEPLPVHVISRIAQFRAMETAEAAAARKAKTKTKTTKKKTKR